MSRRASNLPADKQALRSTRKTAQLVLGLLLAQYALGIYVNLYRRIPIAHPGRGDHNFASASARGLGWALTSQHAPFLLATHASIGLLLLVGATELLRRAARTSDRTLIRASLLGLIAIVGAGLGGVSFLDYNRDLYSYLMAMLFLLALLSNAAALALSAPRNPRRDLPSP